MDFQNILSGLQQPQDPTATDPNTGAPQGDVYNARMDSLRNMSALFLAAGQSMSGAQRAQILSQLGNAGDPTKSLYTQAQARLMNGQAQEAQRKRDSRASSLEALRGQDISNFATDREQSLYKLYLDAGDPDGALDVLSKAKAANSEAVPLQDGSTVTRGVGLANRQNFNKTYAPVLDATPQAVAQGQEALDAIDGGLFSGAIGEQKLAASKLLEAFGIDTGQRDKILNSERVNAATMDAVLGRMQQLGGNDSNEELKRMQASLAGGNLEPETLRDNMRRYIKNKIEAGVRANEQLKRLTVGGQMEYGGPVTFTPDKIWDSNYRSLYDRVTGSGAQAPAAPAGDASTAAPAGNKTKNGVTWSLGQ
ncbi:hypothetical protein [Rhizobium favelukesii]|uniref:Uncharacterized protein n=1 Tax=Rhizobium favelukesii TaxID=348824 RepID=W6RF97_9HYPH|nr:hypothetical protein [Rhizobium favelukesii]MCS0459333.1 hypothetical protein [Rhizobium favelukesii]CDM57368.1 putative predicted protein [Rhizobium favelukesii]